MDLPISGHFLPLAIVNNAAPNTGVQLRLSFTRAALQETLATQPRNRWTCVGTSHCPGVKSSSLPSSHGHRASAQRLELYLEHLFQVRYRNP